MKQQPKIGVLCNSTLGIPSLQALLSNQLVSAIGMPDIVHDATNDIRKIVASFQQGVTVFKKENLRNTLDSWIKNNQLDIVLVFTFPWKIDKHTLAVPKLGFINFHFGLLPQYRGADAIFWSIKNREPFGGISVHQMDANFDTGALIHIEKVPILSTDTYGMHSSKLANANLPVLQKILPAIFSGQLKTVEQDKSIANYYSKPSVNDIVINWEAMTAEQIIALINACNPWNKGAYAMINNTLIRITEAALAEKTLSQAMNGTITNIEERGVTIRCKNKEAILAKTITIEEGIYNAFSFTQHFGIKKGLVVTTLKV